jgi:hypothetical protein
MIVERDAVGPVDGMLAAGTLDRGYLLEQHQADAEIRDGKQEREGK